MAEYELTLHPDKTRLVRFETPPRESGRGSRSRDLRLSGVYAVLAQTRQGKPMATGMQDAWSSTATGHRGRLRLVPAPPTSADERATRSADEQAARTLSTTLASTVTRAASAICWYYAKHAWYKWLNRRSQRSKWNWESFGEYLKNYPLPQPRITVQIWST